MLMGLGTSYPTAPTNAPKPRSGQGPAPMQPPRYAPQQAPQQAPMPQPNPDPYAPYLGTGYGASQQPAPSSGYAASQHPIAHQSHLDPQVAAYYRANPQAPMSAADQAWIDFAAIQQGQADGLLNQYLAASGLGQGMYDNNVWYRNAQAQNDLARLNIGEQRDIGLGRERNDLNRQFAGRAFGIDSRGNTLTRDMRYRSNDSEAAGRGSVTSFGYGQNNRDILGQYGIAQDTTQLTYDKAMADVTLDDKALDLLGKEYGIKRADINNALKFGLTQLGLDQIQAVNQLNQALTSGDAQLQQNAINFMIQMMSLPMDQVSMSDLNLPKIPIPGQPSVLGQSALDVLTQYGIDPSDPNAADKLRRAREGGGMAGGSGSASGGGGAGGAGAGGSPTGIKTR